MMEAWKRTIGAVRDHVGLLATAVVLAVVLKAYVVEAFYVPSDSMERAILAGDFVVVSKLGFVGREREDLLIAGFGLPMGFSTSKKPRRGDIIVFEAPVGNQERSVRFVKRCVAVEGDTIEIVNSRVFVNGKQLFIPTSREDTDGASNENLGPSVVPNGHLFVLGDKRSASFDSRSMGFIPERSVIGRPLFVYWSVTQEKPPRNTGSVFTHIRWDRLGTIVQ
jgi:signal peptidase I